MRPGAAGCAPGGRGGGPPTSQLTTLTPPLPLQADRQLTNLIRRKFAIKNTTGYSLNALVDFPAGEWEGR